MTEKQEDNVSMNITDESETTDTSLIQEEKTLNVNVNFLVNIKSILEITTQRGTFRANELTSVGRLYDDLVSLLKNN